MEVITKSEFERTHGSGDVEEEEFRLLAQLALDTVDLLCFGRAAQKEEAARSAMKELIDYWIRRGGKNAVYGQSTPKSESIGNYSVTNREENLITLRGVVISPAALVILDRAGLRNRVI